jgi:hypothetical protein
MTRRVRSLLKKLVPVSSLPPADAFVGPLAPASGGSGGTSGMYVLVPGKTDDTLYSAGHVKIPNPIAQLYLQSDGS